ncbi:MAG: MBL fold metallo-hydrolase [Eubacteriales bacterium]
MIENTSKVSWRSLADLQPAYPLFKRLLFLEGYDFSSNIYLIKGDYLTLIDAANDYTAFLQLFQDGYKPSDIKKIVLTHGHVDHAMGVLELLQAYPSIIKAGGFELILHVEGPQELITMVRETGCPVTLVRGGEVLDLGGFEFEVIPTSGHTSDGICLYHPPAGALFTGDTVLPSTIAETDQVAGGNLVDYLSSIRMLLKKDIKSVFPGHESPALSNGRLMVVETYEGIIKRLVGEKTPWFEGAMTFLEKGYLEEAVYCLDRWLEKAPEDVNALGIKGVCLNDLGRFNEAYDLFDTILAQKAGDVTAFIGKGYALMGLERYEESLGQFNAALAENPGIQGAQFYKGLVLYLSERYDEAMDIEIFRTEFAGKVKEELLSKLKQT